MSAPARRRRRAVEHDRGSSRRASARSSVELSGRAAELAASAGISGFEASLTHEAEFAAAVVIAELEGAG